MAKHTYLTGDEGETQKFEYNTCFEQGHEHPVNHEGWLVCRETGRVWPHTKYAQARSEAETTAAVTGSVGATVVWSRAKTMTGPIETQITVRYLPRHSSRRGTSINYDPQEVRS